MPDIFISYKREERDVAQKLAEALIKEGRSVWWDINLLPGERFAQEIEAVIRHAKVAIVIWSKHSVQSEWVIEEASEAKRRGILLPISIDSVQPPFGFRGLQTLDCSSWDREPQSDGFRQLIELVNLRVKGAEAKGEPEGQAEITSLDEFKLEAEFWRSIASAPNQSAAEYQSYIDRFGEGGQFVELATGRIKALKEERPSKFFDSWLARIGGVIAVLSSIVALFVSLASTEVVEPTGQEHRANVDSSLPQVNDSEVAADNSYEIESATLSFSGDRDDYITEGENFNFIHQGNAFFTISALNQNQISFSLETPESWSFSLSVPASDGFRAGSSYKASRDAFSGDHFAGLELSGDGRGCNEIDAVFEIDSLQLEEGVPVAARISFTQYCDSEKAKAQGMIVYVAIPKKRIYRSKVPIGKREY